MLVLGVIPARSGSKSLPHKNIKSFSGMPLLAWSIKQAQQSNFEMRIIVSTDSHKYAAIAREWGAETPFLRPDDISQDLSTDFECIQHAITWLKENEDYNPDIILQLNLPDLKVKKVLKFKKGAQTLIIGGSHVGSIATIKDEETTRSTKPNLVMYDGFQTIRPYSFVVGEKKAMVSLPEVKV